MYFAQTICTIRQPMKHSWHMSAVGITLDSSKLIPPKLRSLHHFSIQSTNCRFCDDKWIWLLVPVELKSSTWNAGACNCTMSWIRKGRHRKQITWLYIALNISASFIFFALCFNVSWAQLNGCPRSKLCNAPGQNHWLYLNIIYECVRITRYMSLIDDTDEWVDVT